MPETNKQSKAPFFAAVPVILALVSAGIDDDQGGATTINQPGSSVSRLSDDPLVIEHVFGGLPSTQNVHVRPGYVRGYIPEARIPAWVAYHVVSDYRRTPVRENRFSTFRTDQDVENPVGTREYVGVKDARGYARGHLAPYGVMGGDRNGNGVLAPTDETDNQTVFTANLMSNIAPQHHDAFNGSGGLWFELERTLQDEWVLDKDGEFWVFAGSVIGRGEHEMIGPDHDIVVPPMFFKIVIRQGIEEDDLPIVLAFLFPHQRVRHGDLEDFLVSVDVIEALTNLDFFNEFGDEVERVLEDRDTAENWDLFLQAVSGEAANDG